MKSLRNFFTPSHVKASRDYSLRAGQDKPQLSEKARLWGFDYWDGSRSTGYGGYKDDGRWTEFAARVIQHYGITGGDSVLDIGCGKGFFLKALKTRNPELNLSGVEISEYAFKNADPDVKNIISLADAGQMQLPKHSVDYIFAVNILHNLQLPQLFHALEVIEAAKRKDAYICVESYRNEREKWNLMRWQLTCECFFTPEEWQWIFQKTGYSGDYEFIYFE